MPMTWFRCYSEIVDDPKMLSLTDSQFRIWISLMAMASNSTERGTIPPYPRRGLAAAVRKSEDELTEALAIFVELDMVRLNEDGSILLLNFLKRQYDHPSDRPEATRERKQNQRSRDQHVTPAPVTSMSRVNHDTYSDPDPDPDSEKTEILGEVRSSSETQRAVPGVSESSPSAPTAAATAAASESIQGVKPPKESRRKGQREKVKQVRANKEQQLRTKHGDAKFEKAMEETILHTGEYNYAYCQAILERWSRDHPGHPEPWTLKRDTGPPLLPPNRNGQQQQPGVRRGIDQGRSRKAHDYSAYKDL